MSYTYTDQDGTQMAIKWPDDASFLIGIRDQNGKYINIAVVNEDAPRIALEILKAAGHGGKGEYILVTAINTAVACLERHIDNAERDAKEAALKDRRDELARELSGGGIDAAYDTYTGQSYPVRRAIDRIIRLEEAAK